jgi:VIT1/CCC1 family predicted Fe2+/Mn2+ transporter
MIAFLHRYLDPADSLGELLFGAIMALTFTLGARIIDAVLYLIGTLFYRNQRIHFVRRLKAAASDQEALAAIREEFDLEDEPIESDRDRATVYAVALDLLKRGRTRRADLRRSDYIAALLIAILVALTAIPGTVPFLLIEDDTLALRTANVVQIALLFVVGFTWARNTGASPWKTGLAIVLLGVGLVVVSLALGG